MPEADPSTRASPGLGCWEMGSAPCNAQTESAGQSKSPSICRQPPPIFFLPAEVGVGHSNKYMPTIFLASLQEKSFLASNKPCLWEGSSFTPSPMSTHQNGAGKGEWLVLGLVPGPSFTRHIASG